jgi:hypothetical protein
MSVTPAPVIGNTSTILSTSRSNIDSIGKSVIIVRANSSRTSTSCRCCFIDALPDHEVREI